MKTEEMENICIHTKNRIALIRKFYKAGSSDWIPAILNHIYFQILNEKKRI